MAAKVRNHELALDYMDSEAKDGLVYSNAYDCFLHWNDTHWDFLEMQEFARIVLLFLIAKHPRQNITYPLVGDIIKLIKLLCYRRIEYDDDERVAFNDCYLNLDNLQVEKTDMEKYVTHFLPYSYKEISSGKNKIDKWQGFLSTSLVTEDNIFQPDQQLIDLAQEMFGHYLIPNYKGARAFFLLGKTRAGKSLMLSVIKRLFGKRMICCNSIQTLTTNQYATSSLVGKRINISDEEESKYFKTGLLKHLITGEEITAERKYGGLFTFKPRIKYIFAGNKAPSFESVEPAMKERIIMFPFFRTFLDAEQNKNLETELIEEMPGIIKWTIDGAHKFIENGYIFSRSTACAVAMHNFEIECGSAAAFFDELYIPDNACFISYEELYHDYREWCDNNGRKPLNRHNLIKQLAEIKGVKKRVGSVLGKSARGLNLVRVDKGADGSVVYSANDELPNF